LYLSTYHHAGTKTTLNELYTAIREQDDAHPEAALLKARDFNAGKLKSVLPQFYQHVICATRGKKSKPPLLHTQRFALHLANLTIILSS
jgi:hypothetical protein